MRVGVGLDLLTILGCINTALLAIVGFFLSGALRKLDDLVVHKSSCLQYFAQKTDVEALFSKVNTLAERIAALEGGRVLLSGGNKNDDS